MKSPYVQERSDTAFSSMSSVHLGLQRPSVSLLRISTTGPASAQRPGPARFPCASEEAQAQPASRVTLLAAVRIVPLILRAAGCRLPPAMLCMYDCSKIPQPPGSRRQQVLLHRTGNLMRQCAVACCRVRYSCRLSGSKQEECCCEGGG